MRGRTPSHDRCRSGGSAPRGPQGRGTQARGEGRGAARDAGPPAGKVRLWGRHAVTAALANPQRRPAALYATREAFGELDAPPGVQPVLLAAGDLAAMVAPGAPHQGLMLDTSPLPDLALEDVLDTAGADDRRPIILLDQVVDPQNVGAVLRSAAAFDALALVTQDRHSPPESGALAKAASGALERVPWVRVVNVARARETLAERGYWRLGLDGDGDVTLADALSDARPVLVMGAEGSGLRHNTAAHCDQIVRLPISGAVESLNVSNAAAIALYAAAQARGAQSS